MSVVYARLPRAELERRIRECHAEGLSDSAAARRIGVSHTRATKARRALGLPVNHRTGRAAPLGRSPTRADHLAIARLNAQGLDDVAVSERLRLSPFLVAEIRRRMGRTAVRFRRPAGPAPDPTVPLTPREVSCLIAVHDGPRTRRAIAERLGLRLVKGRFGTASSVPDPLLKLQDGGFLAAQWERRQHGGLLWSLTPMGVAALEALRAEGADDDPGRDG